MPVSLGTGQPVAPRDQPGRGCDRDRGEERSRDDPAANRRPAAGAQERNQAWHRRHDARQHEQASEH
ncbi:MAG: hypothetical protein ACRDLK_12915, partial [Gaiellaceae bacterium]